ncbi:MAG: T9SS type A sorting domain-containing protein, partial [Ignavibacterium sp.]
PISRIRMLNANTGYLIGASGVSGIGFVYKTTDGGLTWTNQNFPFSNNMLYDVAFRNDTDYVVVGAGGGVFRTSNDGASWIQYNLGLPNAGVSQVTGVTFIHPDTLLVGCIGAGLVKVSLEPIVPVELSSFNASVHGNSVNLIWTTATELNNYGFSIERKLSSSDEWINIGFVKGSGTTTEARSYSYQDFDVTAGSYNYRLRQIDYDGTSKVYNLSETVIVGIPNKFELLQNYPNPFNPSTTISFSIPTSPLNPSPSQGEGNRERLVSLTVYNILGQKVVTLLEEDLKPGYYEIEFDASSYNLTSGIYFYTIQAGNFYQVKKMSLIK